jgi:SAM-dependent methyltransferase
VDQSTAREEALRAVRRTWQQLGEDDPLWAVLTDPTKRHRRWDPADFFATGEREIADVETKLQTLGIAPARHLALDFGCGVGRLTRALATRYERVIGIDVAASMIAEARRLNADFPAASFTLNERADLSVIASDSVDFFYSDLVFQHMPPELALGYIGELGRVLRAGGVAMFQVPSAPPARSTVARFARAAAKRARNRLSRTPRMQMHAIEPAVIEAVAVKTGLEVVPVPDDPDGSGWARKLYVLVRNDDRLSARAPDGQVTRAADPPDFREERPRGGQR